MSPLLLLAAETARTVGRIQGGWEFIWACYFIAWGAFTMYALRLMARRRPERSDVFSGLSWLVGGVTMTGIIFAAGASTAFRLAPIVPFAMGIYLLSRGLRGSATPQRTP